MNYASYKNSRNLSWEIIINEGIDELPVSMSRLCGRLGIEVILSDSLGMSGDGKALMYDGKPYIFLNRNQRPERMRFTLAHELGHILLEHIGKYELVNREPSPTDNHVEQEANIFASRLLAPACVLWALDISEAEEIASLCKISFAAAKFRSERMKLLYEREKLFLKDKGKSCFLISPFEKQVFEQFKPFIDKHKN